jgi:hypothetical protein
MKNIEPIQIWKNGQDKTASILDAYIINDNLSNSCTFYWMLKEAGVESEDAPAVGETLADGNVTVAGESYEDWDNSNEQAFELIAAQINVQLAD